MFNGPFSFPLLLCTEPFIILESVCNAFVVLLVRTLEEISSPFSRALARACPPEHPVKYQTELFTGFCRLLVDGQLVFRVPSQWNSTIAADVRSLGGNVSATPASVVSD